MTLSQTATFAKRFILGFIIFSVVGITGYIGYKIWYANYLASLPPKEDKPDTRFGILPKLKLPASKTLSENFKYSLDTATGSLPEFSKIVKVYFMPKASATFLSAEKGKNLAEKFNFDTAPQILTPTRHRFQIDNRILTVDLDTGNFVYQSDATPSGQKLDDDTQLVQNFKNFLSQAGISTKELENEKVKINFLKYDGSNFIPASGRNESQAVQINLWPKDLDKIPIVFSDVNKSLVHAEIIGSGKSLENFRSINFTFWPIDQSTFATYPLKLPNVAFEEMKAGKGNIIITPNSPEVSITLVYLAYFEAEDYTPYLQPIYVFEGPSFTAYVPALKNEYLSQ
ncbi:hypothetical protein A3F00_04980 [Candidatus Daviesbacteria bacterium RIFCSPHIGHO2_12_FULL_37_11]|uniref:Uncharacterized protein n=1 Tax=Candidatus Daviesbacteria bacterium RIFCSPHIGHO2_12_FULL_37_11 TaxID=1797777 RepID=A0A1F5KAG3_9BACT|nr:MAG: hypothetical protein A2111_02580 [Candidatus Daviesbacteria bacterium GWA1_38_6]OGE15972.1 MAG: hypothetical protein A2769_04725 [Candidatus Daviesbacteria bacterium RIFCSPHIGHO2_01_FULL_37_27]OGE37591.1 MAG: hypothetical protein A3F00_04980 [Candidatus Daviesbacteria bacterium RIFCSPHIGHO2_12_FULL_37_11]OGE46028.1 MAG: hypothetical protein A3B39_03400 [Candidatus Daviesbacteria bacterium RIFCSPLOWO2_01_FULL_37_10]